MNNSILIENDCSKIKVGRGERKEIVVLLDGGKIKNLDLQVILEGEGAEAVILGIVLGGGSGRLSLRTLQKHAGANTTSNLLVKGVFFDESRFKYRGLIQIKKGARNANAFQQENNLILSDEVQIDTRPELEIKANEVRCTHAATVSKIDEAQINYLNSRAILRNQAEQLIIKGFLKDVYEKISDIKVKQNLQGEIKRFLRGKQSK